MNSRPDDSSTDSIDLSSSEGTGQTQTCDTVDGLMLDRGGVRTDIEANIIVIAHPDDKRLGSRFRMTPGAALVVGRSTDVAISLPEVLSVSRQHARLNHRGVEVTLEDLGSTNGTYLNGRSIVGAQPLKSGDRFQAASVHFKFLHERDVENAYHEAIYQLVTRDGLTDIYNKRKYEEELTREFARCRRHKRPLTLIVIDLDEFKAVNDGYGHLCGDFVLKEFTALIRQHLRPEQVFARMYGDEFVILAPETGLEGAHSLAAKICQEVAKATFQYADAEVRITCSCGVAELTEAMADPQDLYEQADRALYASKGAGRNQASVHVPDA